MPIRRFLLLFSALFFISGSNSASQANDPVSFGGVLDVDRDVLEVFRENCFACHAEGAREGSFSLDELLESQDREQANQAWYQVLKKLQSKQMPPPEEQPLAPEQISALADWIKYSAFDIDPQSPDPGRVTIRRLNQVEYRNTVRDLLGVDYDTSSNFPADDTGHGFDNLGDVLSMSPLLLEKYLNAAKEIISSVVPTVPGVVHVEKVPGSAFVDAEQSAQAKAGLRVDSGTIELSYYTPSSVRTQLRVRHDGDYLLRLNLAARETYVDNQFDDNRCEFVFSFGGEELIKETFVRQGSRDYVFEFPRQLKAGQYDLAASVRPLSDSPQIRQLRLQIESVELVGPENEDYYDQPEGYQRFFPRAVPEGEVARREYARELLEAFASRAFRRPVDEDSLSRLVDLAESVYADGSDTFESGIAKSMTAVLASPRFLFREEIPQSTEAGEYPLIDEYSLASRLSYFLWLSMPDQQLVDLAAAGKLREQLDEQIARMLADEKAQAFSDNFVGQWLRSRAVDSIQINAAAVTGREPQDLDPEADIRRQRFFALFRKGNARNEQEQAEFEKQKAVYLRSFEVGATAELTPELRTAMRKETELLFDYVLDNDRSLLELIDSDYTFLNEDLWAHYQIRGIPPVEGPQMRLVKLPEGSQRGGVLTQGTMLVVTSNPDRTSPVKRGLFILENLLGTPPAAPPPNVPALEDVETGPERALSLRETLEIHRQSPLCSSCHNQMDPLGLALENFNALGRYRTVDMGLPVDSAGELGPGESFQSVDELKQILVSKRSEEIYRCLTEKLMTFALGRAVEYGDTHTVDSMVSMLEENGGRAQSLVYAIIHSDAFQRTRAESVEVARK